MKKFGVHLVYVFVAVWLTRHAACDEFTLGLLIPYSEPSGEQISVEYLGKYFAPAIIQAVEDVNNRSDLLPGHHLSFIWNDTHCNETVSLKSMWYQVNERRVSAIIGPACSCRTAARLASALDIPMISFMCNNPLYNSIDYSTFVRTKIQVELPKLSRGLAMLLQKFNWSQVAILYENSTYYTSIKDGVVEQFKNEGINVRLQRPLLTFGCLLKLQVNVSCKTTSVKNLTVFMTDLVKMIKENARIILFITNYRVSHEILLPAYDEGMTNGDHVFIMLQLEQKQFIINQRIPAQYYLFPVPMDRLCDFYQALEAVIVVEIKPTDSVNNTFTDFEKQVKEKFNDPIFPSRDSELSNDYSIMASYLYDAVYQYARALNQTLKKKQAPTGRNIVGNLLNSAYESKTGVKVVMAEDGTADFADLGIVDFHWKRPSGSPNCSSSLPKAVNVGVIDFSNNTADLQLYKAIYWPNNRGAPADSPLCGFDEEKCKTVDPTGRNNSIYDAYKGEIIAGVCAFVLVILMILLVSITRHFMMKRKLDSLLWQINYKDISWARQIQPEDEDELSDTDSFRRTSAQFTFTNFGFYKGNRVSVKHVGTKSIDLTKGILLELTQMRDVHHENCVPFLGATVDPPNICIVSAFCPRTLKDFLTCSDVRLDKTFITSLVSDIAKGMAYLHSTEIKSHGNLKSSNCLIDGRWTLKVSDYGLASFKSKSNLNHKAGSADLLWTAPEILRDFNRPLRGTQKGDVYSFAIILQEFHTRRGAYSENNVITKGMFAGVVFQAQRKLCLWKRDTAYVTSPDHFHKWRRVCYCFVLFC